MDVIKMWKDPEYREQVGADDLVGALAHPSGMVRLSATDLDRAVGAGTEKLATLGCCEPWMTLTTTTGTGTWATACIFSLNFC